MTQTNDIKWGVRLGLNIGAMYTALVLILYAFGGMARFARNQISLFALVSVYLLGGILAGFVLGVFRPALRERNTAFVVAVLAALPVAYGLSVLLTGTFVDWGTTAFLSLLIAVLGVGVLWKSPEGGDTQ